MINRNFYEKAQNKVLSNALNASFENRFSFVELQLLQN